MKFLTNKIYHFLTFTGALPFIMCAICYVLDIKIVPYLGVTDDILAIYSIIIATFLAGSHWGQHLSLTNKWASILPIISNIVAVSIWFFYLILSFKALIISLIVIFLGLLGVDYYLKQDNVISREYFQTRLKVTSIVIIMLVISVFYS